MGYILNILLNIKFIFFFLGKQDGWCLFPKGQMV